MEIVMKRITTLMQITLMGLSTLTLYGCETVTTDMPEYQGLLHKQRTFIHTRYLCEVKDWRPWGANTTSAPRIGETCKPASVKLTSPREYLRRPAYWMNWHRDLDMQYRILGIINKNTKYHINEIKTGYESRIAYITIDSGPLVGFKAELSDFSEIK
jgi:hypothetical protein